KRDPHVRHGDARTASQPRRGGGRAVRARSRCGSESYSYDGGWDQRTWPGRQSNALSCPVELTKCKSLSDYTPHFATASNSGGSCMPRARISRWYKAPPPKPPTKPLCRNLRRPVPQLSAAVMADPRRAAAIISTRSKWANGTVLHYCFFG